MVNYEVTLFTGNLINSKTLNNVSVKLVGSDGESSPVRLEGRVDLFIGVFGAVSNLTVSCPKSIGKLLMIEMNRDLAGDAWFVAKVTVKSPEGDTCHFPVFHWIDDTDTYMFREGKALLVDGDTLPEKRSREVGCREKEYVWREYAPGIPHCIKSQDPSSLPVEVRFSYSKNNEFNFRVIPGLLEVVFKLLADSELQWSALGAFSKVFGESAMSEYVQKHWKDDDFFGYQFLNGVNPMLIQRCSVLPENFPVTDSMVFPMGERRLAEELKNGNIYLCDYKVLDGLEANTVNGRKQYLMAPLILLHKTPEDKMMPIAIQLKQAPAKDNPIFLPSDSEHDWLLAKTFVRSSDFSYHQLIVHLLGTHLLAEVFAVSLLRNVPMVHPLYKLLIPHTRYTLQMNVMARLLLISPQGFFPNYSASGKGIAPLLQRSLSKVTYTSLCIPDDIAARGLQDVPNFYYRDDGLKLWEIIHRFVEGVLSYYYKTDADVQKDAELQKWISDIFVEGFLSNAGSGIPQKFDTLPQLVKFVTMVIFTCSGQHSAVNAGQLDHGAWMPNFPPSMQEAPPVKKGESSEETLMKALPGVKATVRGIFIMHVLSKPSTDFVPLGQYPNQLFSEDKPLELIKKLQGELNELDGKIDTRNKGLDPPYMYMKPSVMENSVAT
ncbi:arachidonate 12-lipoxygenase, 12R-type-like [Halichoeres trimaculatus]|uniref:arachidonate 12-lipoxygenase, 12R-type-like n=1 Tax=Halichoeres trimaculatus TaxID=147232 RepID=UPI003D9EBCEF